MNIKKLDIKRYWSFVVVIVFLLISFIYLFILKDCGIVAPIHDNLDSSVSQMKMLKDNNLFFNNGIVPFLGGIDRNFLESDFHLVSFLYIIFNPYFAYIFYYYIQLIVAIIGFICLKEICFKEKDINIFIMIGFIYGLLPTHVLLKIGFSSIPLIISLLISLFNKLSIKRLLFLLIYPMLSSFPTFGIFICGYILVYFIIDIIIKKKPNINILICLIILSLGYILVDWRLFYQILFGKSDTLRAVNYYKEYYDLLGTIHNFKDALLNSIPHAEDLHKYVVLPLVIGYLVYYLFISIKQKKIKSFFHDWFIYLFVLIILNSLIYAFDSFEPFSKLLEKMIPILKGFNFGRAIWLNPFIWYLLFAIAIVRINKKKLSIVLISLSLTTVCLSRGKYSYIIPNTIKVYHKLTNVNDDSLAYNEFFSIEIFDEIKETINYNDDWSIAFGMHPSILNYNGISTLDGYCSFYPNDYKIKFREIIAPELAIDNHHRNDYDNWGGRAYIYSLETHYTPEKDSYKNTEANLIIDINAFKKMNGRYIFSRVKIINYEKLGLVYFGSYSNENSPYTIYLYSI